MASPFAVFRRNQKVLTVVLTCLAMFAFIILDSVSKMDSSAIMPIIFGLIGASFAWRSASQSERGTSYSTIAIGGVLGAVVGVIVLLFPAWLNPDGIVTAHGRLTDRDLYEMKQKRDMANQFVISAFRERKGEVHPMMANYYLNQYRFGDTSSRSVVTKMLLEKEADSLGIEISDEFITNYIKTVSENAMTREALTKIRSQLGMGESELYDTLRSELRARVASRILNPELVHMPDQYWGDFEKLNVRHSIDAVAIPVEPFAARMSRPSDKEIKEIFEAFKGVYPMGENPGFVQPDRLKIAWFEFGNEEFYDEEGEFDFEAAEALVGEIPEDELKARYEEKKETEYKIQLLPDLDSSFDDDLPKFGEPPAPVKITTPDADGEPDDGQPADDAKADDSEAAPPAKTGGDAPAETPKSDDAPATEEKVTDDTSETEECGDDDDQEADADSDDTKKEEQPETTSKDKPAADPEPVEEAKPTEEAPADPIDASKDAIEDALTPDLSEVKYKSFEDVRDEIRQLMLLEKMEERIEKQISAAITTVKDWRFKYREANPEVVEKAPNADPKSDEYIDYLDQVKKDHAQYNADLAAAIAAKAEAYAEANGLKFVNPNEFLSEQELIEHNEYKIGTARESSGPTDFMNQTQPQTAAARLFTGATTLFIPEEAQGQFDDTRYAFWATGENEQHVPTIDEPGVREQVEQAARLKNARSEAQARAAKLATSLKSKLDEPPSIVSIAEGIADQTVFGTNAPATEEEKEEVSSDSEPADDDSEASDESEKEESCGDEEGDEAASDEKQAEESAPAAGEASDEEAPSDEVVDEPLSVISSPPFTWYRQSSQGMQMNPFAQPTLEFGFLPGIDGVDDNFMETVSKTAVGDVVVIPNLTKQVYYVVHVKARNPSENDDPSLLRVRQQFIGENVPMSQIYGQFANSQGSEIYQAWQADFFAKHNVSVEELDAI